MKKLLEPYVIGITILAIILGLCCFITSSLTFSYQLLFFILVLIISELFGYSSSNYRIFSISSANIITLLLFFGPSMTIMCSIIINFLVMLFKLQRKNINSKRNDKRRIILDTIINISNSTICVFIINLFINLLKFNITTISLLKLIVIILIFLILYSLLCFIFVSIARGKWCIDLYKDSIMFFYYMFPLNICLIYLFLYKGIIGAILVYLLFIPLQKMIKMNIQLKNQQKELITDTLTGIYNYKYFEQILKKYIMKKQHFSLLFIDLDKFKYVNDTYGHECGNIALIKFCEYIKTKIDDKSIFCRFGGDEFCILIDDKEKAEEIGNSIINGECLTRNDYHDLRLCFSIGLYNYEGVEQTTQEIIDKADSEMYKAKQLGGNQLIKCNKES